MLVATAAGESISESGSMSAEPLWYITPAFWIANVANLAGIGLFVARVAAPGVATWFGYATQAAGIPALAFGIADLVSGTADARTIGLLAYAGWALGAALIDHVFRVEYRDPPKPAVLVPYVATYYAGIGLLSATQLVAGYPPWIISGVSCLAAVGASFYARAHE